VNFLADIPEAVLRLVAATFFGGVLGIDRELRGKAAGMRTHALVALGAAVMTLLSIELAMATGRVNTDAVSRVLQGIIAGIGFLGGGAILKSGDNEIRGLTTAASIWLVAALGAACGAGQWLMATTTIALALFVLIFGSFVERAFRRHLGPGFARRFAPPPDE
jgi:putative Mg2+ transporter-C (MgtC) family protein